MKLFTSLALSSSGVFSVHLAFSVVYQITCIVHIILYIVYDFWNRIFPLDLNSTFLMHRVIFKNFNSVAHYVKEVCTTKILCVSMSSHAN